jgi:hypothetical protein
MAKITVTKIVNTKPDKYGVSVRVKSQEYGDKEIFMMSVKDPSKIVEKGVYEGEFELWKEFEDGTKWNSWKWPKKEDVALSEVTGLKMTVSKHEFKISELEICIKALAYKAGLQVKELRALAEEADRGYKYPVNDMPLPDFEPEGPF